MKSVLVVALLLAVVLINPSKAFHCSVEPDRCSDQQCCVEWGVVSMCRPLKKEGEKCELQSLKKKKNEHVYLMMCPCGDGLTCEQDDSGSILTGKCVQK